MNEKYYLENKYKYNLYRFLHILTKILFIMSCVTFLFLILTFEPLLFSVDAKEGIMILKELSKKYFFHALAAQFVLITTTFFTYVILKRYRIKHKHLLDYWIFLR